MNLELLDPWEQEYPQIIEETLEDGYVLTSKFNRKGTLLAAGCQDGRVVVWDFDTRGVARNLHGHVKQVTTVSWSRNGRYLLSASRDWNCIFWDLLSGMKQETIRFSTQVVMAQMHPRNNSIFVTALLQEPPVLVEMVDGTIKRYELPTEMSDTADAGGGNTSDKEKDFGANGGAVTGSSNNTTNVVCFDRRGDHIYAGTAKGFLNIIEVRTRKIIHSMRITSTQIKQIHFSRKGKDFVVNANDRIIRVLHLREEDGLPEVQHKFQDLVNRVQWSQTCFSADGDFVIGGSAHKAEHNIYIWDKNMGNLVKILEGPKEPLDDLVWHPIRPIIASVGGYGNIHIWATNHEENWSAFAPDFKELEENLEYEEREDEFDVVPEEEVSKRKQDDEDIIVDVLTTDNVNPFNDSDTDGPDDIFYLPTRPDEDGNLDGESEAVGEAVRKKAKHTEGEGAEGRVAKKKKRSYNDV